MSTLTQTTWEQEQIARPKTKVFSLEHLSNLIRRGFTRYILEAEVQSSKEIRCTVIFIDAIPVLGSAIKDEVAGLPRHDNFDWDICALVLSEEGKRYNAVIYCPGEWSAHEIAAEVAKWNG